VSIQRDVIAVVIFEKPISLARRLQQRMRRLDISAVTGPAVDESDGMSTPEFYGVCRLIRLVFVVLYLPHHHTGEICWSLFVISFTTVYDSSSVNCGTKTECSYDWRSFAMATWLSVFVSVTLMYGAQTTRSIIM